MRMIPIHVDTAVFGAIGLGKQGEKNATRVRFYAPSWYAEYPGAEYQLFVTPPGEATPYLAQIEIEAGTVTWDLQEADTAITGSGTLELILTDGETKIKSVTYRTWLDKSPSSQEPGNAPDVHPTWWENAIKKIEAATTEAIGEIDGAFEAEKQEATAAIVKAAEDAIASIPADYTELAGDVSTLKDAKADAITDTSARAASHELHAQRGPMSVTLFGKTTETGSGDKSPDNPYVISGVGFNKHVTLTGADNEYWNFGDWGSGHKRAYITSVFTAAMSWNALYVPGYEVADTSLGSHANEPRVWFHSTSLAQFNIVAPNAYWEALGITNQATFRSWLVSRAAEGKPIDVHYADADASTGCHAVITAGDTDTFNTITPPLLPDGAPLMGNGTVDDTVGNDVLSGCDKRITFADADDLTLPDFDITANVVFSDTTANITVTDGVITSELTYPCTVYYRSTDYTPDKDLRVRKVVRRWETLTINGDERYDHANGVGSLGFYAFMGGTKTGVTTTGDDTDKAITSNMFKPMQTASLAASSSERYINSVSNAAFSGPRFVIAHNLLGTTPESTVNECVAAIKAYFKALHDAGTPVVVYRQLGAPETYMTDRHILRKPDGMADDATTHVAGSEETAVEYPHDTKHYIDSKISELVTLALASN